MKLITNLQGVQFKQVRSNDDIAGLIEGEIVILDTPAFVLLAVCSLQYFTINRWTDERFAYDSVILLTAYILLILLPMVWQAWSIKERMRT